MLTGSVVRAQREITSALHTSAATLAEKSGGLLIAYDPDLRRFPYQSLSLTQSHYRLDGTPLDPDTADSLAGTVDPRYKGLPQSIRDYDTKTGRISRVGTVLRSGQNAILGGGHGELIDVPLELVGVSNFLQRQGVAHRSGMIVSKAVDYLGVNLDSFQAPPEVVEAYLNGLGIQIEPDNTVTARSFFAVAADETYFTLPSSQSFSDIRLSQREIIKRYNSKVLSKIKASMKSRADLPMLLDVALPGTVVKLLDVNAYQDGASIDGNYETVPEEFIESPEDMVEVIGRISAGIADFTAHALLFGTSLRLDDRPPQVAVTEDFYCVRNENDVKAAAKGLVKMHQGLNPGATTIYDVKGNLPVIRK